MNGKNIVLNEEYAMVRKYSRPGAAERVRVVAEPGEWRRAAIGSWRDGSPVAYEKVIDDLPLELLKAVRRTVLVRYVDRPDEPSDVVPLSQLKATWVDWLQQREDEREAKRRSDERQAAHAAARSEAFTSRFEEAKSRCAKADLQFEDSLCKLDTVSGWVRMPLVLFEVIAVALEGSQRGERDEREGIVGLGAGSESHSAEDGGS